MPKTVRVLALSAVVLVLAGLLLALPSAVRWLYHHEGRYQAAPAPRPDLSAVTAPAPESSFFVDEAKAGPSGTVLVDRAHSNRFEMSELSVLRSRLSAKGWTLEPVTAAENLAGQLRSAQALVVISPGKDWTASEIDHVREFVDSGGRLLLVTDPTRYGVLFDEEGYFLGYDYDAGHANDLASEFGLVFQTDYLYNTVDYESNFRNIRLGAWSKP